MVPIPDRMKKFPLWKGKYPMFYTLSKNADGTPNFKAVSRSKQIEAIGKNLCHICGEKLTLPYWFILLGEEVEHRHTRDGPMHRECAVYAGQTCPFLSNPYARRTFIKPEGLSSVEMMDHNLLVEMMDHNLLGAGALREARIAVCSTNNYSVADMTERYPMFIVGNLIEVDWSIIPERKSNNQ